MTRRLLPPIALAALVLMAAAPGQPKTRALSTQEKSDAIAALMAASGTAMAEEPSCKSDLSKPGAMLVGQGVARLLTRAVEAKQKLAVSVGCFERDGWPKQPGQEYCKLGLSDPDGTGLVFLMDWSSHSVVAGSVECTG